MRKRETQNPSYLKFSKARSIVEDDLKFTISISINSKSNTYNSDTHSFFPLLYP